MNIPDIIVLGDISLDWVIGPLAQTHQELLAAGGRGCLERNRRNPWRDRAELCESRSTTELRSIPFRQSG